MDDQSNKYFEQFTREYGELTEETLIFRMNQCNVILAELSNSQAWKILIDDSNQIVKYLDDNWQHMETNTEVFMKSRVTKMAHKTILDIPKDYLRELTMIEEKLKEIQNPGHNIEKDADNN